MTVSQTPFVHIVHSEQGPVLILVTLPLRLRYSPLALSSSRAKPRYELDRPQERADSNMWIGPRRNFAIDPLPTSDQQPAIALIDPRRGIRSRTPSMPLSQRGSSTRTSSRKHLHHEQGQAKILDFWLAKVAPPKGESVAMSAGGSSVA